ANQHRSFACAIDAPSAFNEGSREPTSANAADISSHVNRDERRSQLGQTQPVLCIQVFWQPEQVEPPDGISQELAEYKGPRLAMGKQLNPGNLRGRFNGIALNVAE